jgi:aminoglycoside 6-adenylyltransferase
MRSEEEIYNLVLDIAIASENIRAVVLNGSRADPNAPKDIFQDYDIVYFVRDLESFTSNHNWIGIFGERLILQMPEQMTLPGYPVASRQTFSYLMLFKDKNRIDLTLFPVERITREFSFDSLSVRLLDKDNLFPNLPPPDESDYLIRKPAEKEFADVCNEFWWVCPYVAKGLARGEITYAKDMLENPVRMMFLKMIEWQIGIKTDFRVNFGKSGKNLKRLVDPQLYEKILLTYPDGNIQNIWKSLFLMTEIFDESARTTARCFGFIYDQAESQNVINYLKDIESLPQSPSNLPG